MKSSPFSSTSTNLPWTSAGPGASARSLEPPALRFRQEQMLRAHATHSESLQSQQSLQCLQILQCLQSHRRQQSHEGEGLGRLAASPLAG